MRGLRGKGSLLFEGTKSGDTYEGTAYVFSRHCGAHPYSVHGVVSFDSREVTLEGRAPAAFDATCGVTAYRQDFLRFTFVDPVRTPEVNGVAYGLSKSTGPPGKATEKHVQQNVCTPVIQDALAAAGSEQTKARERTLIAFCAKCFIDEEVKNSFSQEELAALDQIHTGRGAPLGAATINHVKAKYERVFESCSQKLVDQLAAALAARN